MEISATFVMPSRILSWLGAKILADCDTELVLEEYYKERLETRLKKKKEKTEKQSTATDPPRLNLLQYQNFREKPSLTRPDSYPLPTPPSSPITPPFTDSSCFCYCHLADCIGKFIPGPAIPNSRAMTDSDKPSQATPVDSDSMEPESAANPASSLLFQLSYPPIVMPYQGSPGTLFFEGANISDFLDRYSRMCSDYRISEKEKIRRLPWYCEMFTGKYIETLIGTSGTTWSTLRKVLREEYRDQDLSQQMNSRRFLETYKDKSRSDTADVLQYCRQYSAISESLVSKGKLDSFTQSRWFIQGLASTVQSELFYRYELDPDEDEDMDFKDLLKKALALVGSKKRMIDLIRIDKKNDRITDLVDKCEKKSKIISTFSNTSSLPESAFQPSITPVTVATLGLIVNMGEKKINKLTKMMHSLAFSV